MLSIDDINAALAQLAMPKRNRSKSHLSGLRIKRQKTPRAARRASRGETGSLRVSFTASSAFNAVASGDIPHGRRLTLTYSNGTRADVYFDQGFGTRRPARRTKFRFDLQPIAQLDNLAKTDIAVISNGMTYITAQIWAR